MYLEVSVFKLSTMQSIIYICTARRVHAAHRQMPQVFPLLQVLISTFIYRHNDVMPKNRPIAHW